MKLSAQQRLSFGMVFLLLCQVLATDLAMRAPTLVWPSAAIKATEAFESPSTPIAQVATLNGIAVTERLRLDEPDQLGRWDDYFGLMDEMNRLYEAASNGALTATLNGQVYSVTVRNRTLLELPPMFWFQLGVGSLAFLIAFGVYAFRPNQPGARHFAVAGFGIMLAILSASVYSTRELLISGETMLWLSRLNQLGAFVFTAGLVALLLNYPKRLFVSARLTWGVYALGVIGWSGFAWSWYPETTTAYISVLALFAVSFALAALQWRRTARAPVERASLKWYLLSIYIGTGLFAVFILVPVALNWTPPASQGLMFMVFLLMFVGMALGILRYRLFELDRWWLVAWSWLVGGLVLVATDALLIIGIGLHEDLALALSLALIGWVYFPLRQAVAARFYRTETFPLAQLKILTERLAQAPTEVALTRAWQQTLMDEWRPLDIETVSRPASEAVMAPVTFADDGETLVMSHLKEGEQLRLHYPNQGHRLFNVSDRQKAQLLFDIGQQALKGLRTRLQAAAEKERILSDLHDDVGAKLLSLLYKAEDAEAQTLVRAALKDLREIVSQPKGVDFSLAQGLAQAETEMIGRLTEAGKTLHWQVQESQPSNVSIRVSYIVWNHLLRILREAVTNIIKHSPGRDVWVTVTGGCSGTPLQICIDDNGVNTDPRRWLPGRGMRNIRYRVEQLSGQCDWSPMSPTGVRLTLQIPVTSVISD